MAVSFPSVTPDDLRRALASLVLAASGFTAGRGRQRMKANLRAELQSANKVLRATTLDETQPDEICDNVTDNVTDPEKLVCIYIENGGDWQQLIAAINRHALEGATRQ